MNEMDWDGIFEVYRVGKEDRRLGEEKKRSGWEEDDWMVEVY